MERWVQQRNAAKRRNLMSLRPFQERRFTPTSQLPSGFSKPNFRSLNPLSIEYGFCPSSPYLLSSTHRALVVPAPRFSIRRLLVSNSLRSTCVSAVINVCFRTQLHSALHPRIGDDLYTLTATDALFGSATYPVPDDRRQTPFVLSATGQP